MLFKLETIFLILLLLLLCRQNIVKSESAYPQKTSYNEELARKLLYLAAGAYAVSPSSCVLKFLLSLIKF